MQFTKTTCAIAMMALAFGMPGVAQAGGASPGKGPTPSQNAGDFRFEDHGGSGRFGRAYGYGHGNGPGDGSGHGNGYGHDKGHGHGHDGGSHGNGHCKDDGRCHASPG